MEDGMDVFWVIEVWFGIEGWCVEGDSVEGSEVMGLVKSRKV